MQMQTSWQGPQAATSSCQKGAYPGGYVQLAAYPRAMQLKGHVLQRVSATAQAGISLHKAAPLPARTAGGLVQHAAC